MHSVLEPTPRHQIPTINRRGLLSGALLGLSGLGLAACSSSPEASVAPAQPSAAPAKATPSNAAETPEPQDESQAVFEELEKTYQARLGVYALDTGSGQSLGYHAGELFAMCSTFKLLAVGAVLGEAGVDGLSQEITWTAEDRVPHDPVTQGRTSMSLGELCQAALQQSDGTAANLLLGEIGGPGGVTDFARSLGDRTTRLDRMEPDLAAAVPGDERDTSTPEALGNDLFTLLEGEVLAEVERRRLKEWMLGNTTGDNRIRAGVPNGWKVADKTGSGSYGTANDIALLYPKGDRAPIVLAIMSTKEKKNAERDEKLLEEATRAALAALRA